MLQRTISLILLFTAVFACLAIQAAGQMIIGATDTGLGGAGSITGKVLAASGQRFERPIGVRLQTMTKGDRVTITDSAGQFSFRGLVSGDYTIVIDKEKEFQPYVQTVSIVQVRGFPPTAYNMVIRLKLKPNELPKPGVLDVALTALPDRGRELFTASRELAKNGDHKGAIEQLILLTAEFPDFVHGFNELGVEYLRVNQPDKADEAFQAALKIEPDSFAPMMNRGIALVTMRRYADAEPVLRSARKADEHSIVVRYFLGQALANLGKFDEAEKELTAAVADGGPEMKEAHRILAIIYSAKGQKKRAAAELETYLQLAPKAADAEQLRKVIRQLKGIKDTAAGDPPATKPPL